jgi:hypothetical protein
MSVLNEVAFVQLPVGMANASDARMDGTMEPMLRVVAEHEVVFAVWQEAGAPHGVGVLLVKGAHRLGDITAAVGWTEGVKMTAIKTSGVDQAEALRDHVAMDPLH